MILTLYRCFDVVGAPLIAFYLARRRARGKEDLERFYDHLKEVLTLIGYINPRAPKKLFERLRRLYARTRLEKEEVQLLRGILTLTEKPKKHSKY